MHKQLARGFRNVEIVFKELLDGEEGFMVERLNRPSFKDLPQEHVAEGGRELIDQTGNPQVVIADDRFFGIEHLADLQRDLRLLEAARKVLDPDDRGPDPNHHLGVKLAAQRIYNRAGELLEVFALDARLGLLDQHDVTFRDVENEILLLVREEVLDHIECGNIVGSNDPDQQDYPGGIGVEMQLAGFDINITRQDIIKDHVFNKVAAVIFFVVILLDR